MMQSSSARLAALMWALPSVVHGSRNLASADIKTGFEVVIEYVTATDCAPQACGAPHRDPFKTPAAPPVTVYTTVLPEICEAGWRNATYTVTETLNPGSKPTSGHHHGGPPPGFTVTTAECRHGCGATPTVVIVTVPDDSVDQTSTFDCSIGHYTPTGFPPRPDITHAAGSSAVISHSWSAASSSASWVSSGWPSASTSGSSLSSSSSGWASQSHVSSGSHLSSSITSSSRAFTVSSSVVSASSIVPLSLSNVAPAASSGASSAASSGSSSSASSPSSIASIVASSVPPAAEPVGVSSSSSVSSAASSSVPVSVVGSVPSSVSSSTSSVASSSASSAASYVSGSSSVSSVSSAAPLVSASSVSSSAVGSSIVPSSSVASTSVSSHPSVPSVSSDTPSSSATSSSAASSSAPSSSAASSAAFSPASSFVISPVAPPVASSSASTSSSAASESASSSVPAAAALSSVSSSAASSAPALSASSITPSSSLPSSVSKLASSESSSTQSSHSASSLAPVSDVSSSSPSSTLPSAAAGAPSSTASSSVSSSASSASSIISLSVSSSQVSSSIASSASSSVISSASSSQPSSVSSPASSSVSSVVPSSTSASIAIPTQNCFQISGASTTGSNPANTVFSIEYNCGVGLNTTNFAVLRNGGVMGGASVEENKITLGNMNTYSVVSIFAFDLDGSPLIQTIPLLFGTRTNKVAVVDKNGIPVVGATVTIRPHLYYGFSIVLVTDATGEVTFTNLADSPYTVLVTGAGGLYAAGGFHSAAINPVTVTLRPFTYPVASSDDFGLATGWISGTYSADGKRSINSGTNSQIPQFMSKAATLLPSGNARSIYINYMFQAGEDLNTAAYTDYFVLALRTNTGSPVELYSQNVFTVGKGSYDGSKKAGWYAKELRLPAGSDATSVQFEAAVSNMRDNAGASYIHIRGIGVCDQCASCESCPMQARCQAACQAPATNQCNFYSTCVEETMRCGDAGYVLAEAYPTCERLRELVKTNSLPAASNNVITLAEKCAQQALVSHLSCGDSCANINTLAPAAQGTCYTSSGYCALGGYDAARILAMLGPQTRLGLGAAIASTSGCRETLLATVRAERAVPGMTAEKAWVLYAAEVFFEYV